MLVKRKSYRRKDGTRVKSTTYRKKSAGRSRGNKSSSRYSRKRGYSPWITRSGKLGGKGFLSKSSTVQHKLLDSCVKKYGYKSCLGSIMVLMKSRNIDINYGAKLTSLKNYLKRKYGNF
jgi:hypothetical protein